MKFNFVQNGCFDLCHLLHAIVVRNEYSFHLNTFFFPRSLHFSNAYGSSISFASEILYFAIFNNEIKIENWNWKHFQHHQLAATNIQIRNASTEKLYTNGLDTSRLLGIRIFFCPSFVLFGLVFWRFLTTDKFSIANLLKNVN